MPNALLEALSLGCAVVAYEFEPSWSEFDSKEAILFVEKGNIKELSRALVCLEKEPILREKLQKNAQKISQMYTQETCLHHWRELIATIAQKESNSCAEF
jgi:glycosyltransferase involved in cell wall biosynthesis